MKSLELFAGGGGLAIGLDRAGFNASAIVEFNKDACETLRYNYLGTKCTQIFEGDIKRFDYSPFIDDDICMVSGGPPCQPFSLGGSHKANSDNRDMFPEAIRAISELRPKAFIFENVKGLLRKSFADYFEYILLRLQYPSMHAEIGEDWQNHLSRLEKHHTSSHSEELEYNVVFRLVNSADFGVPQKRERVFIVGFRSDIDAKWSFPEATHSKDSLLWHKWVTGEYWKRHNLKLPTPDISVDNLVKKYGFFPPQEKPWVTVRDSISDLPDPKDSVNGFTNHIFRDGARSYPGHTGSYIDEPSKTLKAGAHGVPGGEDMIRFEDGTVRYFTVRESARIQTFPDSYAFRGAWGEAMRQLGNAVPVKLASAIGGSVYKALNR